jgi:sugar phosphate isomerase/epimerase
MLIGAMNHPGLDVIDEMRWMAEMKLDFIDLTVEPPCAASWQVDRQAVRSALDRFQLQVVGHTAYYLPFASPFEPLRKAAVDECCRCLELFADIGARWMNIHPDNKSPLQPRQFYIDRNLQTLSELLDHARKIGIGLMVENIPGHIFNSVEDLGALLDALPDLGLHLDIGHCNLSTIPHNAVRILEVYGGRLQHVHLHDNKGGGEDLHLPLGTGNIDVSASVRALKHCGYDGTITLEVFSPEHRYLAISRDILRAVWERES